MTTSTTPINNHSWPHLSRLTAVALMSLAAASYWAYGAFVDPADGPVNAQSSEVAALTQSAEISINPFEVMSDLTPVVSALQLAHGASAHPFEVMSDLTPVVSALQLAHGASADPFEVMSDLTPVVSAHQLAHGASADPFEVMSDLTQYLSGYVRP